MVLQSLMQFTKPLTALTTQIVTLYPHLKINITPEPLQHNHTLDLSSGLYFLQLPCND